MALADLRELVRPNGAVLAGAADRWEYVWPRDSAFVAVALAETGHPEEAARVLGFLDTLPLDREDGFEARYHLDGAGPPDDRERQLDGCGWVLWSLERVHRAGSAEVADRFAGMQDRCTAHLLAVTEQGRRVPPASPDYWEVSEWRTTLGTAAPVLAGLAHSAELYAVRGLPERAAATRAAAQRLERLVHREFGPEYERYGGSGGLDAAVAMLLPPFTGERHAVVAAWERYQLDALQGRRRPRAGHVVEAGRRLVDPRDGPGGVHRCRVGEAGNGGLLARLARRAPHAVGEPAREGHGQRPARRARAARLDRCARRPHARQPRGPAPVGLAARALTVRGVSSGVGSSGREREGVGHRQADDHPGPRRGPGCLGGVEPLGRVVQRHAEQCVEACPVGGWRREGGGLRRVVGKGGLGQGQVGE